MLITTDDLLLFTYIHLFCFLGAFSKDILDIFLDRIPKVLIFKVLISTLCVTVLLYGLSDLLLNKLSYRLFTTVCFVFGIVSFELSVNYNNINKIKGLIKEIYKINKNLKG